MPPTPTSGPVSENVVALLYELMRDHLPVGVVRSVVSNSAGRDGKLGQADEPLRQVARDMAATLQNETGDVNATNFLTRGPRPDRSWL